MRVKCIDNKYWEEWLTLNKIYEVIKIDDGWYLIINDISDKYWYPEEWFKPLSEFRNEKINKLLENESGMYK